MSEDVTDGFGPESYTLFADQSDGDAVLGDYTAFVRPANTSFETEWTLTATVNGEVVWIEEGFFEAQAFDSSFFSSTYSSSGGIDSSSFDFSFDEVRRWPRVAIERVLLCFARMSRRRDSCHHLGPFGVSCRLFFSTIVEQAH